ncbi:Metal-dependent hydrolase with rhodanese-homology domain (RHOD) [Staphylococcus aureus]|uniref:Metal-dependent hydrolase with rhodanese-homology domain (RHOD) n=1 Tax=Staphylococcus aureus TaxID=1280 RepID=A0A380ECW8_STAAU|nr:Metal-dependent hydrolase with rhodanese-homology domain (RHOD) [Staphylococcus aureus]
MTGKEEHVLDVRNDEEWNNGHLDQAVNIPHGKLLNEIFLLIKRIKYMYIVSQVLEVQLQWVYWKAKVLKMW